MPAPLLGSSHSVVSPTAEPVFVSGRHGANPPHGAGGDNLYFDGFCRAVLSVAIATVATVATVAIACATVANPRRMAPAPQPAIAATNTATSTSTSISSSATDPCICTLVCAGLNMLLRDRVPYVLASNDCCVLTNNTVNVKQKTCIEKPDPSHTHYICMTMRLYIILPSYAK